MDDLWDPQDYAGLRQRIDDGVLDEWSRVFPAEYGGIRLEADNLRYVGKNKYTLAEQKRAWLEDKVLRRLLKADLRLVDATTGDTLDERKGMTLMSVPHYTNRGTFVYNGNNYPANIQTRLIPGAYVRRQNNGALEAQMNVRAGTGRVFRIGLDPSDGQFRLRMAGSNLHLYSVLKDLGVTDDVFEEAWGSGVTQMNQAKYDTRALGNLYQKAVPAYARKEAPPENKAALVIDAFDKAQLAQEVTDRTLGAYWRKRAPEATAGAEFASLVRRFLPKGKSKKAALADLRETFGDIDDEGDRYHPVGIDGLLAATRKLLAINRGQDSCDDRNVPSFMKAYPMDKLMREKIRLDEGKLRRGLLRHLSYRRNLDPVRPRFFDPYVMNMITRNPLTSPVEETNPLQLISQQRRMTAMGPGGIGSSDAITADMQAFQAAEVGFISPLEGPECFTPDVEVMTSRGWQRWDAVEESDLFPCRGPWGYKWFPADRLVCEHYEGEMLSVYGSVQVTPNHRVCHVHASGELMWREAELLRREGLEIAIPTIPGPAITLESDTPETTCSSLPALLWLNRVGTGVTGYSREIRARVLQSLQRDYGKTCASGYLLQVPATVAPLLELLAFTLGYETESTGGGNKLRAVRVTRCHRNPRSWPSDWKRFQYSGSVYCATVPGGNLFVRTSGRRGHWSGNSERAGVDVRLAAGVKIGKNGRLYRQVVDRQGNSVLVTPGMLVGKTLGVPD